VFISLLASSFLTLVVLVPSLFRMRYEFDPKLWRRMMMYAMPLILVGLAGMINETFDRIMLKFYLPLPPKEAEAQIGIYGANYKLSILMTLFVQSFRMAAEPFFFNESKKMDAKHTYARTMNVFVITCCFIFLVIMLFIDVFKHFMGDKYYPGLPVVPILLIANLCLGVYYNLTLWYKLTDQTRMGAYISVGGAIVTLIFNFLWIPTIGYMGSAWATLICYASMMVASFLLGQKYYPVPYNMKKFLLYVGLALLLYFLSTVLQKQVPELPSLLNYGVGVLFLVLFAGIVYFMEVKNTRVATT
jgi:O-antigen/teichoic acid export membrane protein